MWCRQCQQDVPAFGAGSKAGYACARCGNAFTSEAPAAMASAVQATAASSEARADSQSTAGVELSPLERWSTWELNEQLRHVERVIKAAEPKTPAMVAGSRLRFDPVALTNASEAPAAKRSATPQQQPTSAASLVAWLSLGLGMGATACGAVLSIWGLATQRSDLWHLGLPIVLAGQFALVIGLLINSSSAKKATAAQHELSEEYDDRANRERRSSRR